MLLTFFWVRLFRGVFEFFYRQIFQIKMQARLTLLFLLLSHAFAFEKYLFQVAESAAGLSHFII
jgi:hypothetical protein